MTKIRTLDNNGDWTFGKGKSNYRVDEKALAQHIISRVREWKTDCFFAQENGVDWNNRLGYKNQETILEDEIRDILLKTDQVLEVLSVNANIDNRKVVITASIKSIYSNSQKIDIAL